MSSHDEIAKVAQELFEKSGRAPGRDLDNWFEAERIVKARHGNGGNGKEKESAETEEAGAKRKPAARPAAKKTEAKKAAPRKTKARKAD